MRFNLREQLRISPVHSASDLQIFKKGFLAFGQSALHSFKTDLARNEEIFQQFVHEFVKPMLRRRIERRRERRLSRFLPGSGPCCFERLGSQGIFCQAGNRLVGRGSTNLAQQIFDLRDGGIADSDKRWPPPTREFTATEISLARERASESVRNRYSRSVSVMRTIEV